MVWDISCLFPTGMVGNRLITISGYKRQRYDYCTLRDFSAHAPSAQLLARLTVCSANEMQSADCISAGQTGNSGDTHDQSTQPDTAPPELLARLTVPLVTVGSPRARSRARFLPYARARARPTGVLRSVTITLSYILTARSTVTIRDTSYDT